MSTRRSSYIWYHFESKEAKRAQCKYCSAIISTAGGSFGNLPRHLKKKHPSVPIIKTERIARRNIELQGTRSTIVPRPRARPRKTTVESTSDERTSAVCTELMTDFTNILGTSYAAGTSQSLPQFILKPLLASESTETKAIDKQLLKMLCKEYHPFSLVENAEFGKFVNLLCVDYKLPTEVMLYQNLLPQFYTELAVNVKTQLSNAVAVALTTDAWTSSNQQTFIAITAHHISSESVLRSNLLGCIEFDEKHPSLTLGTLLRRECEEWDIISKLVAIVTDDAPDVLAAAKDVSRHIPSFVHSLNLVVKAGISPIADTIEKCKSMVQYFNQNAYALAKLKENQRYMNLPDIKLIEDSPTRWNSTYEMLRRLSLSKEAILSTIAELQDYDAALSNEDWAIIENATNILAVFDEITWEVTAEKTVTLSKVMVLTRNIQEYVREICGAENAPSALKAVGATFASEIRDRLACHAEDSIPDAALLDPRFKKTAFDDSTEFEAAYERVVGKIQSAMSSKESAVTPPSESEVSSDHIVPSYAKGKLWKNFDKETRVLVTTKNPKMASIMELDKYLAEPLLPRLSDPLIWWQQRKAIYPYIYQLAMESLCVPASSVPCGGIFSKTDPGIYEKRNCWKTNMLSKILFVQCNAE